MSTARNAWEPKNLKHVPQNVINAMIANNAGVIKDARLVMTNIVNIRDPYNIKMYFFEYYNYLKN